MSGSATAPSRLVLPERSHGTQDDDWKAWLQQRIDPDWRPGEWNPEAWLFTGDAGNPRTWTWTCLVDACPTMLEARDELCRSCHGTLAVSGQVRDEFIATHVPRRQALPGQVSGFCMVGPSEQQCQRPVITLGLCASHYSSWNSYTKRSGLPSMSLSEWSTQATPFPLVRCHVLGCDGPEMNARGLCTYHWRRWHVASRHRQDRLPHAEWAVTQTPYLAMNRFSIALLPSLLRLEIMFGLQQRDKLGRILSPKSMRAVVNDLTRSGTTTFLDPKLDLIEDGCRNDVTKALIRQVRWSVALAFDEYRGVTPLGKDVLDLRAIGLKSRSRTGYRVQAAEADLTVISQPWLRDVLRAWVDAERPIGLGRTLRAAFLASQALNQRPGGGQDISALRFADMNAVADQFRNALRLDGKPYSSTERRTLFTRFCELLDCGRRAGLLNEMAGSFVRDQRVHRIEVEEANEDEIGKAVPEFVIRQLDEQLDSLGLSIPYGRLATTDIQAMFRTVYIILRDTGRRPGEVASLVRDCLETIDGQTSLVWNNGKGKRNRRRLPVTEDTAQAIRIWRERSARLPVSPQSTGFLFPAISEEAADPHMSPGNVWLAIRTWVDALPTLGIDTIGDDGNPLPFDRDKVYPRAFRHSYAQRHADAGTPVDVLKELMDHVSVQTTMGYYTVSLKRKQEAVKTLSAHTVDRSGNPAPFHSGLAYQRSSVAVPFGGCTEPSNVKAGGQACPIRFQCAACPFYRPDPSYLPAIEQQINDLRADRETAEAMGAAEFVTRNLTEQIDSYRDVVAKMRTKLAELPADERTEIEEASVIMRRARAGSGHTLLPLKVIKPDGDDE